MSGGIGRFGVGGAAAGARRPGGPYSQDVDWSLFGCAGKGHVSYAPDEPELRDRLMARTADGTAWRCLRCGAFRRRSLRKRPRPSRGSGQPTSDGGTPTDGITLSDRQGGGERTLYRR